MARETIPTDSTFQSLAEMLVDPVTQIRDVLEQLILCKKEHNNSHVRLGITGAANRPYYKIFSVMENGEEGLFGTFQDEASAAPDGIWSTRSSNVSEIQSLLQQLRR
jgi:hypothetical protein